MAGALLVTELVVCVGAAGGAGVDVTAAGAGVEGTFDEDEAGAAFG